MKERLEERVERLERALARINRAPGVRIFQDLVDIGQDASIAGDLAAVNATLSGTLGVTGIITASTPMFAKVYNSSTQSLTATAYTTLTYDTEVNDTNGMWTSGNPTRLTAPVTGYYLYGMAIRFATGSAWAGSMGPRIVQEGTQIRAQDLDYNDSQNMAYYFTTVHASYIAASGYVEFQFYNGHTSAINTTAAASNHHEYNSAWMARIA